MEIFQAVVYKHAFLEVVNSHVEYLHVLTVVLLGSLQSRVRRDRRAQHAISITRKLRDCFFLVPTGKIASNKSETKNMDNTHAAISKFPNFAVIRCPVNSSTHQRFPCPDASISSTVRNLVFACFRQKQQDHARARTLVRNPWGSAISEILVLQGNLGFFTQRFLHAHNRELHIITRKTVPA